jgi:chemotaxis protein CheX
MKSANEMLAAKDGHEDWVPPMEVAAREVFELMLGCKLTVQEAPSDAKLEITAMVGLAGKLCGVFRIRCDAKVAALIASKMLGIDVDKVGAETSDAMGEIANMVAGNFKNKISGLGDTCMLSPPTIITGSDYDTRSLVDAPVVELNLLFENMPLVITLQVHS